MLQKLATGLVVSLVMITGLPIIVLAQEDTSVSNDNDIMTTQQLETTNQTTSNPSLEAREARIKELKEKTTARISAAEERRVVGRCSAAQKIVGNLQTRLNTVVENRREKYTNLTAKFLELSEKLKVAGVDTTELDGAISDADVTIQSSLEKIDMYNETLAVLAEMDCEKDPTGFKLVLDEARKQRTEIIAMQGALKSSINVTIRPILAEIRTTLEANTTNDEGEEQ
jgi:hypothetical protein